tara:strand:- start:908 stop:2710 length:1803 start_codon:yes stop_codon:yes gene_type:complete
VKNLQKRLLVLTALLTMTPVVWAGDWHYDNVERVVAIADIHGAFDAMTATLGKAKILDDDLNWSGGKAHLVVVGDIIDRGPGSRRAMELLMRLEGEAEAAGGRVHVLFGNHETMPMTGDLRYVSDAEYAAFADDEDLAERSRWLKLFAKRNGSDIDVVRARFNKKFPPGYFAMRRAFRADGRYGSWLLQKNIIVVINGTAFVHGGLSPAVAKLGLQGVNGKLKSDLAEYVRVLARLMDAEILLPTDSHYDYGTILKNYLPSFSDKAETLHDVKAAIRLEESELLSTAGPLWYRGNVVCPEIVEDYRLDDALAAIDARRVVVGHTPTPNRKVLQRFDGRLIEIDTGMLHSYYKGSGNALIIEGDTLSVVNQSADEPGVPMEHPRHVGRRPADLGADELQELLVQGNIVSIQSEGGTTIATVQKDGNSVRAFFERRQGRGVYPDVAAYRLDKLLELDMVPVAVVREVDGRDGSLQFLPDNSFDEVERSSTGAGAGAHCPMMLQWDAMYLFDTLIYNEGRSPSRMDYDRSSMQLMLSEHDQAFLAKKGRPRHLANAPLEVTRSWREALAGISDDVLAETLGDVLDKRRLRALAARRDELLATE